MSEDRQISAFKNIKILFSVIMKIDSIYMPILIVNSVLSAMDVLINIFVPMVFINGFQEGWTPDGFLYVLGILVASKFLLKFLKNVADREMDVRNKSLENKFAQEVSRKAMELSYEKLEDPKILDLKERALFPITNYGITYMLLNSASGFLTALLIMIGTIGIIVQFSFLLGIVSTVLSIVIVFVDRKMNVYLQNFSQDIIPINRKYGYYSDLMFNPTYHKEIRLYNMSDLIITVSEGYINAVFDRMQSMYEEQAKTASVRIFTQTLIRFITYSYAAVRVLGSQFGPVINIGQFAVIVGANENFISSFQKAFTSIFDLKMSLFHLEPFGAFMTLDVDKSENKNLMPESLKELKFENVSFSYPHTDRVILDDISFTIRDGEKISIVGLNNAGKSTIVKLICRLFTPDSGRILWNGTDIGEYNREAYMKSLSCVFQDFALFPFSIEENIVVNEEFDGNKLEDTLEKIELSNKINELPLGVKTKLNKDIYVGATDFSGGEKQKLAIGRALYRDGQLIILDEPTAALDPMAESEIYENFNELTKGKTSIFISHRMSSSTFCDKVLLLDGGKIVAFDSHNNLMEGHNLYRQLFESQAQYFQTNQ